jgi:hypothetical protein
MLHRAIVTWLCVLAGALTERLGKVVRNPEERFAPRIRAREAHSVLSKEIADLTEDDIGALPPTLDDIEKRGWRVRR